MENRLCLIIIWVLIALVPATSGAAQAEALYVEEIRIEGNQYLDDEQIARSILKTRVGAPFVEQWVLDDLHALDSSGWFQDVAVNVVEGSDGVIVTFAVMEFPLVTKIELAHDTEYPLKKLLSNYQVQPGMVLNVLRLYEDIEYFMDVVKHEYGPILHLTRLDLDLDGVIHLAFHQIALAEVVIQGNEKTKGFVINRELRISPGDKADLYVINRGLRRVFMLGLFDEVESELKALDEGNPGEARLLVTVKEKKTGSATFGVSFGSNDGLVGFVEVADSNFLGRAQRINASVHMGKSVRDFEVGFFEPYIDKSGTSLDVRMYNKNNSVWKRVSDPEDDGGDRLTGNRKTIGGNLTLAHPTSDYSTIRLILKAENNLYTQDGTSHDDWYKDYNTRIMGFGMRTNATNHPFKPSEGYKSDSLLEMGTTLLGGDSQFAKLTVEHSRYYQLWKDRLVLAIRGMGGRVIAGEAGENERYVIGGAETLRGYRRGADQTLVGERMLVVNSELRISIMQNLDGVLFSDWGRAWSQGESVSLSDFNYSFGLGVRLDTPLGLLRLDWGLGHTEDKGRSGQFYFGLGHIF